MKKWEIGTILSVESLLSEGLEKILAMEMDTCQLAIGSGFEYDNEKISQIKSKLGSFVPATAILGWPGPAIWNFYEGPKTLGLRPKIYREERMQSYYKGLDVTAALGIKMITTHIGFVPEDPNQEDYIEMVKCLKDLAVYSGKLDITFCLETGQETPITLKRMIEDAGSKNLGINLDPANLLMYGKANPADAVDVFGEYVKSMHIKDGAYPTNVRELGEELPVGSGNTDFPKILQKLSALGFDGPLIIEREISGEKQLEDIKLAHSLLKKWISEIA